MAVLLRSCAGMTAPSNRLSSRVGRGRRSMDSNESRRNSEPERQAIDDIGLLKDVTRADRTARNGGWISWLSVGRISGVYMLILMIIVFSIWLPSVFPTVITLQT